MKVVRSPEELFLACLTARTTRTIAFDKGVEKSLTTLTASKHKYGGVDVGGLAKAALVNMNRLEVDHDFCAPFEVRVDFAEKVFGPFSKLWVDDACGAESLFVIAKDHLAVTAVFAKTEKSGVFSVNVRRIRYDGIGDNWTTIKSIDGDVHYLRVTEPDMWGYVRSLREGVKKGISKQVIVDMLRETMSDQFYLDTKNYFDYFVEKYTSGYTLSESFEELSKRVYTKTKITGREEFGNMPKLLGYPDMHMLVGMSPTIYTDRAGVIKQRYRVIFDKIDADLDHFLSMVATADSYFLTDCESGKLSASTAHNYKAVSIYIEAFYSRIQTSIKRMLRHQLDRDEKQLHSL